MFDEKLKKIGLAYIALQVIILAKCAWFFALYGFGRVDSWNAAFFPANTVFLDFVFHEAMHVGIGILALWFGKNLKRIEWIKLVVVVFVAVALHNVGYWFSSSHAGIVYSAVDFAKDSAILLAFVVVGFFLARAWTRQKSRKQKI